MTEPSDAMTAVRPRVSVKVWDAPTRVVHGLLPLLIAFSWGAAKWGRLDLHRLSGYAILGLLVFCVTWGFVGSQSARFQGFVRGPNATLAYLATLPSRRSLDVPGHNPLGAWSVLAMLGLMLTQVGLGLFSVDTDGLESGPLASSLSFDFGRACAKLHHIGFNLLLWLIGLHVAAIAFYLVWKRENLIGPMIGGSKVYRDDAAPAPLRFAPAWRLAAAAAFAALAAWLVAKGLKPW